VATQAQLIEGEWRVGDREFPVTPFAPNPARRIAAELGLSSVTPWEEIQQLIRSKTWDTGSNRWVNDRCSPS
jgi:hypothetical protein